MFVQIGNRGFNPDFIEEVWFYEGKIVVYFAGEGDGISFEKEEERRAFLDWWENKADVYEAL